MSHNFWPCSNNEFHNKNKTGSQQNKNPQQPKTMFSNHIASTVVVKFHILICHVW